MFARASGGPGRLWALPAGMFACVLLVGALGGCPNLRPPNNSNGNGNANDNGNGNDNGAVQARSMVVLGYNDLGMHCMNEDFSELMILPPFNTLHAQVIRRGEEPQLVTSGVTVNYRIVNNTRSADKTNFWDYAEALFGTALQADVGLTGNSLSGSMTPTGANDWSATGIPVTPIDDNGNLNPYNLASVTVSNAGSVTAETLAVVPVSWEIRCDLCHTTPGISVATDILRRHDQKHATSLESAKPVMCAACHADPALGQSGEAGVSTLSSAMHSSHADRMSAIAADERCYACHPGQQTQCLRDVHYSHGMTCTDCHTSMAAVGNASRRPWVDLPRCGDCHQNAGHDYEQADTLYRNSVGHGNVHCSACHGSPHAITPTVVDADNLQAMGLQGHAGKIDTCSVCHLNRPDESFFHHAGGEGE